MGVGTRASEGAHVHALQMSLPRDIPCVVLTD